MTSFPAGSQMRYRMMHLVYSDLVRAYVLVNGAGSDLPPPLFLWSSMFSPRYIPVLLYRISHAFFQRGHSLPSRLFSIFNFVFFGVEISPCCRIGPGLFLPHTQGTVIGAWSIGSNATIFQGVTIGASKLDFSPSPATRPVLGHFVTICAGAVVIGGLSIGDNCIVGANAVVLDSVPSCSIAVGVPARVLPSTTASCHL